MGAYDPNPGKDDLTSAQRAPPTVDSVPSLSRAPGVRNMVERFDDLSIRGMREGQRNDDDTSSDNLFQVMKAVEDAEATIKQQVLFCLLFPPFRVKYHLYCSLIIIDLYVCGLERVFT